MSMFSDIQTPQNVVEEKDVLGGGFKPLDTDVYLATIKHAYGSTAQSGAKAVNFEFELEDGRKYRETLYVTSREGKPTYTNQKGEVNYLPSYSIVDGIALFTTQKPLNEQATEPRTINLYDFNAKKELPKEVPMLMDMVGKQVKLAISLNLVDKTTKNDNTGKYEPTGETKEENSITKVFHPVSNKTVPEVKASQEASFHDAWLAKNKGQVFDRTSKTKPTTATKTTTSSLFA